MLSIGTFLWSPLSSCVECSYLDSNKLGKHEHKYKEVLFDGSTQCYGSCLLFSQPYEVKLECKQNHRQKIVCGFKRCHNGMKDR